jgi:hypothetical protein
MLGSLVLAASLASTQPACPLENAQYVLQGASDVIITFEERAPTKGFPSDVTMNVQSKKLGAIYRFVPFNEGSGAGIKSHLALAQEHDEPSDVAASAILGADNKYLVAGVNYVFDPTFLPRRKASAPDHLFIPGLQELFWYGDLQHREAVPVAFFNLAACSR